MTPSHTTSDNLNNYAPQLYFYPTRLDLNTIPSVTYNNVTSTSSFKFRIYLPT